MFIALSEENPTVLSYINKFIALGPVAFVNNAPSPIFKILVKHSGYFKIARIFGLERMLPYTSLLGKMDS